MTQCGSPLYLAALQQLICMHAQFPYAKTLKRAWRTRQQLRPTHNDGRFYTCAYDTTLVYKYCRYSTLPVLGVDVLIAKIDVVLLLTAKLLRWQS